MESNLAGVARVAFEAVTGEFNRDVSHAEQKYRSATEHMSDGALKLELAQARLQRQLAKGPAAYREIASAELAVRRAQRELRAETDLTTKAIDRQDRELRSFGRGGVSGFSSMRGQVLGLASAFVGTYGLINVLKQSVAEAREAETVQAQLGNAVRRAGIDYAAFAGQIEKALQAQSKMASFDDEELAGGLTVLVRRTKDVNEALRLNALAANVARGRNVELEAGVQIVLKAYNGQVGGLRRLGLEIDKNATSTQALAKLQQAYGNSAATFAETSIGKQERLNKTLGDSKEIIGTALIPTVDRLASSFAGYLEGLNDSGELQRRVESTLKDVGAAAKGVADGLELIRDVTGPVVDAMGGIDNAAQTFLILGALAKMRRFIGGFTLLKTTSATTKAAVMADMAAMSTAAGGVGGAGGRRSLPIGPGGLATVALIASQMLPAPASGNKGTVTSGGVEYDAVADENGNIRLVPRSVGKGQSRSALPGVGPWWERVANAAGVRTTRSAASPGVRGTAGSEGGGGGRPGGKGPAAGSADLAFDIEFANATTDRQRVGLANRRLGFLLPAIARFEADKDMTVKEQQRLLRFIGERDRMLAIIDGVEDAARAKREQAADERERREEEAARKAKAREEAAERKQKERDEAAKARRRKAAEARRKVLEDAERQITEEAQMRMRIKQAASRFNRETGQANREILEQALKSDGTERVVDDWIRRTGRAANPAAVFRAGGESEEFKRMAFAFLGQLQGVTNQFGSNVKGPGGSIVIENHWPTPAVDVNQWGIYQRHSLERAGMVSG